MTTQLQHMRSQYLLVASFDFLLVPHKRRGQKYIYGDQMSHFKDKIFPLFIIIIIEYYSSTVRTLNLNLFI